MRMTIRNSIGGSLSLENEVKKILLASISNSTPSDLLIPMEKQNNSNFREMSSPESLMALCSWKELSLNLSVSSPSEADEISNHIKNPSLEDAYQSASRPYQHEEEEKNRDVNMEMDKESSQQVSGFNCNEAGQTIVEESNQETRVKINVKGLLQIRYEPVVLLHSSRDVPANHGLEEIKKNEPENTKTQENDDEMNKDLLQTSSQSNQEANSPRNPSDIQSNSYNEVVSPFLSYFRLKEENIRQTVVRRFKFCMKKISQDFKRYKNLSSVKYLKLVYRIMKLYHIDSNSQNRDFAENVVFDIRYLIDQLGPEAFDVVYGEERSCNNNYINELFSNSIMRDLYRLHHSLASQGRIYFEKFKQFNYRNLTRGDKERIIFFCEKFLEFYTKK